MFRMVPKVLCLKGHIDSQQVFFGLHCVCFNKTSIGVQGDCIINHLDFRLKCVLLHSKKTLEGV